MSDITDLFNRDPLELTDPDIDEIIKYMRERRQLFKTTPTTKAGAPKKLTAAQQTASKLNLDFDL